jgi:hypothetical protein
MSNQNVPTPEEALKRLKLLNSMTRDVSLRDMTKADQDFVLQMTSLLTPLAVEGLRREAASSQD